ncbi:hypothetical protein DDE05_21070 [Streptomyces cavourensis]|nr:hypothetical protein DDE05_21070 [Streptomyces cavourensis]
MTPSWRDDSLGTMKRVALWLVSVEVGALAAPCSDQSVDLVLHVDQCRGSVDMKSLEFKCLDIKISGAGPCSP